MKITKEIPDKVTIWLVLAALCLKQSAFGQSFQRGILDETVISDTKILLSQWKPVDLYDDFIM